MAGFDETVDFVVVGSGGGSMCAALVLRDAGRSVLILEKTDKVGGTTAKSGGVMWVPNNPFMAAGGIPDSAEQAAAYLDSVVGDAADTPGATRARRLAYLAAAPRMVEYLVGKGVRLRRHPFYPDYYDERPGGSVPGRAVISELYDTRRLGAWAERLRPGFLPYPARLDEVMKLPHFKVSWSGKAMMARVAWRTVKAKLTGAKWVSAGAALQGQMLEQALAAGVEIRPDTPVGELIEEDGAIVGVVAVRDGKPWRIGARSGVLVNAGGFAHNQAMRDRWQPGTRSDWSGAAPGDTGEMIEEMARHGAALAQMEEMVGHQSTVPPGPHVVGQMRQSAQATAAGPHAILVDQSGVRYMNEAGSYMLFCQTMFARDKVVPAVPSYVIFDAQAMRKYMIAGTMPGSAKPKEWTESGYLAQGPTIAALAARLKMDPATLEATVTRFNGFVDGGRDEDFGRGDRRYDHWLGDPFHKPSSALGRIETGPFYALPVVPGDVGTYGGVVTDVHARVLREDGTPIPGLYATGVSTASVMGRAYPGAGSSVGPSFTWGFVAALHACGADNRVGVTPG